MTENSVPHPADFGYMRWAANPHLFVTSDGHHAVTYERPLELIREALDEEGEPE